MNEYLNSDTHTHTHTHLQTNKHTPFFTHPSWPLCLLSLVVYHIHWERTDLLCGCRFYRPCPEAPGVICCDTGVYIFNTPLTCHPTIYFSVRQHHFGLFHVQSFFTINFGVNTKLWFPFLIYAPNPGWKFTLHHCRTMILYLSLWSCTYATLCMTVVLTESDNRTGRK